MSIAPGVARAVAGAAGIQVAAETTADAARRLVQDEKEPRVVALNFASARNPGGGFLGNAEAQEEDLARRSGLYQRLLVQPDPYRANRAEPSLLHADYIVSSPDVPFFRDRALELPAP